MTALRLLGSALLLSCPLLARTQSAETPPRYYVGLAAYSSDYQSLGGGYYRSTTVPVQLTLGYQLRPRLALQLGAAYSGNSSRYAGAGQYYGTPTPQFPYSYYDYTARYSQRVTSVTLLARYALTRQPTRRLQFDLLGGVGLEITKRNYSEIRTSTDSAQTVSNTSYPESHYTSTDVVLAAGIGTRYRFSRHLEAALDVTLNKFLFGQRIYSNITSATALGLRYRFGQR